MNRDSLEKLMDVVNEECRQRGIKTVFKSENRRQSFFGMLERAGGENLKIISRLPDKAPQITVEISGDKELAADIFEAITVKSINNRLANGKEIAWELTYHSKCQESRSDRETIHYCECPVFRSNEQGCSDRSF